MRTPHRVLVASLVGVVLLGCSGESPTASSSHVGTYVMHTAAGQSAPAVIHSVVDELSGKPIDLVVLGDTLELKSDGTYVQRAQLELRLGGVLAGRSRWTDHGFYSLEGSAVHFDSDFMQNVAFSGALTAGSMLTVIQNLAGEGTDDEYVLARTR